MSNKEFLISEQLNDFGFISESAQDSKTKDWFLKGVFGEAELINRNQRKYPLRVMTEAVEEIQPIVQTGLLGEYHHPKTAKINSERACIRIQSLVMEGKQMMGVAKVLRGTTLGNHLIGLLENKIVLPVSSRAVGKLVNQGNYNLVESMKLATVDVVDYQSCQTATPDAIFESVNWLHEIKSISDEEAELLNEIRLKESASTFKKAMQATNNNILKGLDNVVKRAYLKLGLPLR